jgi:hypothetical protein
MPPGARAPAGLRPAAPALLLARAPAPAGPGGPDSPGWHLLPPNYCAPPNVNPPTTPIRNIPAPAWGQDPRHRSSARGAHPGHPVHGGAKGGTARGPSASPHSPLRPRRRPPHQIAQRGAIRLPTRTKHKRRYAVHGSARPLPRAAAGLGREAGAVDPSGTAAARLRRAGGPRAPAAVPPGGAGRADLPPERAPGRPAARQQAHHASPVLPAHRSRRRGPTAARAARATAPRQPARAPPPPRRRARPPTSSCPSTSCCGAQGARAPRVGARGRAPSRQRRRRAPAPCGRGARLRWPAATPPVPDFRPPLPLPNPLPARYAFNIIFNILNKSTLNTFPCPWLISTLQLGAA